VFDAYVRTEDAAKINRIVERLEYGRFDETGVVVEAERDLEGRSAEAAASGRDAADRGVERKDAEALLGEILGDQKEKGEAQTNPTAARTEGPSPSEPSSKRDGHPQDRTTAERDVSDTADSAAGRAEDGTGKDTGDAADSITGKDAAARSKTREGRGFDGGGQERTSVKAKIEQKRTERSERREQQPDALAQTRHQAPQPKRKRAPKDKTQKGR
jgi:hypothetical protein